MKRKLDEALRSKAATEAYLQELRGYKPQSRIVREWSAPERIVPCETPRPPQPMRGVIRQDTHPAKYLPGAYAYRDKPRWPGERMGRATGAPQFRCSSYSLDMSDTDPPEPKDTLRHVVCSECGSKINVDHGDYYHIAGHVVCGKCEAQG